ncbi:MAG TPA: MATE family efflux transporter [Fimbriimonadaceae bacterium]|nr:MATE family efflux transporter [Fimbriimonadaceae bacterium]
MALTSRPLEADLQEDPEPREHAGRVLWALAWPAVALNSLQVLNTLLDRFFIGHLPEAAITAHGASTSVMFLLFTLAISVATGTTAVVSRAFGAGNSAEFRRASREGLSLAFACGLLVAAVAVLTARACSSALLPANDHAAQALMARFLTVYASALPPIFIIQVLAGSLRGIGDTRSSMVISGLQIFLHMALNCVLVFPHLGPIPGAGLGMPGAALALSISAWVSAVVYVVYTRQTPLQSAWVWRLPHREWAVRILKIAAPQALMALLRISSLGAFQVALKFVPNGSTAIGAMSIAFAIESIMIMPSFGLAAAAGALVGQSLGMRRPDRAERLGWTAGAHGALVTALLAIPVFFFAGPMASMLLGDKREMIATTVQLLRLLVFTEVGFAYAMILFGAMQGAGDTARPTWISLVALWGVRVPLAYILALHPHQPLLSLAGHSLGIPIGLGLGALGAWISMAITQGIQGVMALFVYRQGSWKLKHV